MLPGGLHYLNITVPKVSPNPNPSPNRKSNPNPNPKPPAPTLTPTPTPNPHQAGTDRYESIVSDPSFGRELLFDGGADSFCTVRPALTLPLP